MQRALVLTAVLVVMLPGVTAQQTGFANSYYSSLLNITTILGSVIIIILLIHKFGLKSQAERMSPAFDTSLILKHEVLKEGLERRKNPRKNKRPKSRPKRNHELSYFSS